MRAGYIASQLFFHAATLQLSGYVPTTRNLDCPTCLLSNLQSMSSFPMPSKRFDPDQEPLQIISTMQTALLVEYTRSIGMRLVLLAYSPSKFISMMQVDYHVGFTACMWSAYIDDVSCRL